MNKDALKKYHFWFLFIPYLVAAVVVVVVLWTVIGPKTEAKQKAHDDAAKQAQDKAKSIKPEVESRLLDVYNDQFEKTRVSKWQENWMLQIGVEEFQDKAGTRVLKQTGSNQFRWPNSRLLDEFNYVPDKYTEAP